MVPAGRAPAPAPAGEVQLSPLPFAPAVAPVARSGSSAGGAVVDVLDVVVVVEVEVVVAASVVSGAVVSG